MNNGANDQRKFVVRKKDPAKIAAEKKAQQRSFGAMLLGQKFGVLGLFLIVGGIILAVAFMDTPGASYFGTRIGMALVGCGIASLGYWGFANNNRDYHF